MEQLLIMETRPRECDKQASNFSSVTVMSELREEARGNRKELQETDSVTSDDMHQLACRNDSTRQTTSQSHEKIAAD